MAIEALICCPFCGEPDFDQVGLKGHLLGNYGFFATVCPGWENADTDEQWELHAARQPKDPSNAQ